MYALAVNTFWAPAKPRSDPIVVEVCTATRAPEALQIRECLRATGDPTTQHSLAGGFENESSVRSMPTPAKRRGTRRSVSRAQIFDCPGRC
jgi:hypothetical protein